MLAPRNCYGVQAKNISSTCQSRGARTGRTLEKFFSLAAVTISGERHPTSYNGANLESAFHMAHPENTERPPETWQEFRLRTKGHWARHALCAKWVCAKLAWGLDHWSLLKILSYAETFSVLTALVFWVAEAHERTQQKHYQAWQVINTAQGKGGSGGRLDALEQLSEDHVLLVGVDASEAFLQDINLDNAELRRATFRAADLRRAHFRHALLEDTNFTSANLRSADLRNADLAEATMIDADLTGANLGGANVRGAVFDKADLRGASMANLEDWRSIESLATWPRLTGVQDPPDGLEKWAVERGAVQIANDEQWNTAIEAASPKDK